MPPIGSDFVRRVTATTFMPNACASRAISDPMAPAPISPSVLFVLCPPLLSLPFEHEWQLLGKRQQDRKHVLADRRRLDAPRVADDHVAGEEFRKAKGFDGNRRRVDPLQPRRTGELGGRHDPCECDVAVGQSPSPRRIVSRMVEDDVGKTLAECLN